MKEYKRICVIGNSGAGKSTFSNKLAKKFDYPLCHSYKIIWQAGWVKAPKGELINKIQEFIAQDKWIFDGNGKSTYDIRLAKADLVIFLDLNPFLCCWRAIFRALTTSHRLDMAEDCVERIDFEFYRYILTYRKKVVPVFYQAYEKYKENVDLIVVKNQKELDVLLEKF